MHAKRMAALATAALAAAVLGAAGWPAAARAADETYELVIKDHKFTPERLDIPAGQKVTIVVRNQDDTPEEFDSHDLRREKVVSGHQEGRIIIGPLDPGEYHFIGEFHEDSAHGMVVAR